MDNSFEEEIRTMNREPFLQIVGTSKRKPNLPESDDARESVNKNLSNS